MSITEVIQQMRQIPYKTLYDFINESYDPSQFQDFHERSVDAMGRHDPKGFLIDEILGNILYGDEDLIMDFLLDHLQIDC